MTHLILTLLYYQDRGAVCRSLNPDCSGGFQVRYLARTDARMNTENQSFTDCDLFAI